MFEIVIIGFAIIAIAFLQNVAWSIAILILAFGLVLPGVYAMLFGAPFVPSSKEKIDAIMRIGRFKKSDVVVEPGCGDGRIIRRIAKQGVRSATGIEFSFPTYLFALIKARMMRSRAKIVYGNMWEYDYGKVDVIVCYLLIGSMKRFEKNVWPKLKKGSRVVSNVFKMRNVKPTKIDTGVYLYVKK